MTRPRLLLCHGSHCRKALARDGRLERTVARLPVDVRRVGCQKVCRGPVVGIAVGGEWEWFERMDSKKALRALVGWVEDGTVAKPLRKRRDKKRSGKRRS